MEESKNRLFGRIKESLGKDPVVPFAGLVLMFIAAFMIIFGVLFVIDSVYASYNRQDVAVVVVQKNVENGKLIVVIRVSTMGGSEEMKTKLDVGDKRASERFFNELSRGDYGEATITKRLFEGQPVLEWIQLERQE